MLLKKTEIKFCWYFLLFWRRKSLKSGHTHGLLKITFPSPLPKYLQRRSQRESGLFYPAPPKIKNNSYLFYLFLPSPCLLSFFHTNSFRSFPLPFPFGTSSLHTVSCPLPFSIQFHSASLPFPSLTSTFLPFLSYLFSLPPFLSS